MEETYYDVDSLAGELITADNEAIWPWSKLKEAIERSRVTKKEYEDMKKL
jgi:hypothetical protein